MNFRDHPVLLKSLPGIFILLFALSLPISIAAAQICLTVLFVLLVITFRGQRLSDAGTITVPLILYSGFSMISAVFSLNLAHSLKDIKSLVLFATPFIIAYFKEAVPPLRLLVSSLYLGAGLSAAYGLFTYWDSDGERATGFMSHYMTFAEQMMMVGGIAGAMILFGRSRFRVASAFVLALLMAACAASLTRSAWIATAVGMTVIVAARKPLLTLLIPPAIGLVLLLAPPELRERAMSVFDPATTTNRNRVYMARSGLEMIKDHPLLGVGPDVVGLVYGEYKLPQATPGAVHLHNNMVQIAAERGLPALAAWLYLMIAAGVASFRMLLRSKPEVAVYAAASLYAVFGMFTSGLFEFNFEDSEIKLLFLFILTMMFLAREGHGTEKT